MAARYRTHQRRRIAEGIDPTGGWTVSTSFIAASGRHLSPGTEVSITGERGRFRFVRHVVTDKGVEWLDFIGGTKGVSMMRAFRPERIKRVHTKKQTMTAEEARRLVNDKNRIKRQGGNPHA